MRFILTVKWLITILVVNQSIYVYQTKKNEKRILSHSKYSFGLIYIDVLKQISK